MKEFVARCATGDWDAVVITHDAFVRIPVSKEAETAYLRGPGRRVPEPHRANRRANTA